MTIGAKKDQTRQFASMNLDSRPPGQGSPGDPARGPKLMDQLHEALRSRHYSRSTEQAYCHWVKRFIYFHNGRHPAEIAEPEINAFLSQHHTHETILPRAVKEAARNAGVIKRVGCHTFRHAFATHLLEAGYDIHTIQELLGHKDVSATMIYTHVLKKREHGVRSPVDVLSTDLYSLYKPECP